MMKFELERKITILANLGVIAGIVFLGIEIQQNTETQKLMAAQQVLGLSFSNSIAVATDRSLNEAFERMENGEELRPGQLGQMNSFVRGAIRANWQAFVQRQYGFLDDDIFHTYERGISQLLSDPFSRQWWERNKANYPENYRAWVDGALTGANGE